MRTLTPLLFATGLSTAALSAAEWQRISDPIFAEVAKDGYADVKDRLNNRIGGLVVLPADGQIFVTLNRTFGVWRSGDAGNTWSRVDTPVQGRIYTHYFHDLDYATGRFAQFMVRYLPGGPEPTGAIVTDAGRTWKSFTVPKGIRHDGFTWGAADWTSPEPQVLLGKQHHAYIVLWLSTDAGSTWRKLPFLATACGVLSPQVLVAVVNDSVTKFAKSKGGIEPEAVPPYGIYRSTDQGETWSKVSDHLPTGKHPVRWQGRWYWMFPEGLLVSNDEGATWAPTAGAMPGTNWGPLCDPASGDLMVVGAQGFSRSSDGGATWRTIAPFFGGVEGEANTGANNGNHQVSYGWDPVHGRLYAAPLGAYAYRLDLPEAASR
jgi:photosystem II stability/assembly factor-like uncharacterized protein